MNLGKRLKKAREQRGMTQGDLADRMRPQWNQAAISALEARDSAASTRLFSLADALQVSPRWLLTGEEPSGLDQPLAPPVKPDKLLSQLIDLYKQLSDDGKHELITYANYRHSQEFPHQSASNPYPKHKIGSVEPGMKGGR